MRGRWFRQYESTMDDPKVQMLSDWQYRAWHTLLCIASKAGGEFSDDINTLAFILRKPPGKVRETMQVLLNAKLFDKTETGYKPHNWDQFQYKSDVSNERVKAFRERGKAVTCNVTETVNETPPDTDTDTEQIQNRNISARKRASKIIEPESFQVFWDTYPDSRARPDALKAYVAALNRAEADEILAGAQRYALEVSGKEKEFIKMAGGWLRNDRWKDGAGKVVPLWPNAFNTPEELENQRRQHEAAYGKAPN